MIGTKRLLELVKNNNLVEGLCERELTNPEGEGFDLRVGSVYRLGSGERFLGVNQRATPVVHKVADYSFNDNEIYELAAEKYVLFKTIEKVNLPKDISVLFTPRTTLQRCGVQFLSSNASPGYCGELTFGFKNLSDKSFYLEMGARVCSALFFEVGEIFSEYRGQWQEGRVSTGGESEEQV